MRTGLFLPAVLAFGVVVAPVFAQGGAAPAGPQVNPPPPNGPQLYADNCSQCHGDDGDNVSNVDLMHGRFRRGTTDDDLVNIVLRGIPGTDMPPHSFTEAQAASIIQSRTFRAFEVYFVVTGIYLLLALFFRETFRFLYRRWTRQT